jgi:hypothetical protein
MTSDNPPSPVVISHLSCPYNTSCIHLLDTFPETAATEYCELWDIRYKCHDASVTWVNLIKNIGSLRVLMYILPVLMFILPVLMFISPVLMFISPVLIFILPMLMFILPVLMFILPVLMYILPVLPFQEMCLVNVCRRYYKDKRDG